MSPGPTPELRIVVVRRREGLDAHAVAWDELAAPLTQALPMLTHAWIRTILEQARVPDERLLCLFAYEGAALVGVLAGVLEPTRVLGGRGVKVVVPCRYHVESGDLVLRPDRASVTLPALLTCLRREVPRLLALELEAVREVSPTWAALDSVRGLAVAREDAVQGSSFPIRGDVDTWFSSLSKNLRSDLRRSANRMRKDGLGEPEVTFLVGDEADPAQIAELAAVEASGWKGRDGVAIESDEEKTGKYIILAERFAARGMLEWHRLTIDGRLAAMHMAIRLGPRLMLLRQGLDAEFARYAAGNHLLRAAVAREFERDEGRGEGELNLVTDYAWCRRWRMDLSWYRRVRFVPRRVLAYASQALPVHARNAGRRVPGLREWVRRRRALGE